MRIKNASPYDGLAEAVSMDLDVLDGSTSPFITLDACDGDVVSSLRKPAHVIFRACR